MCTDKNSRLRFNKKQPQPRLSCKRNSKLPHISDSCIKEVYIDCDPDIPPKSVGYYFKKTKPFDHCDQGIRI